MAYPISPEPNAPNNGPGGLPAPSPTGGCNCTAYAYEIGHHCYDKCKGGNAAPTTCPPGQEMINGKCRFPGDFPCPPGQCKDSVTGVCRSPGKNEKVRESDGSDVRGLCRQYDPGKGPGGGGAGGGGGVAPPKAPGAPGTPGGGGTPGCPPGIPKTVCDALGISGQLQSTVSSLLNAPSRYDPATIERMKAASFAANQGQTAQNVQDLEASQASRGMYSSGFGASEVAAERRAGAGRISADSRAVQLEKTRADFEDKLQAIGAAQNFLSQSENFYASLNQTQAERERTEATIKLGYAQLAQAKELFIKQLASNKELLQMSLNSAEWRALLGFGSGAF